MAGGGVVAAGVVLIIAGVIVPSISVQSPILQGGGIQVSQTTYPYAPFGPILLLLGFAVVLVGAGVMALSVRDRREEREQREERQRMYELSMMGGARIPPATVQMPPAATPVGAEPTRFCPACGTRTDGKFCENDATETRPIGGPSASDSPSR